MDDFVLNVRQISQYPLSATAAATDAILLQSGGVGGAYSYTTPSGVVGPLLDPAVKTLNQGITDLTTSSQAADTALGGRIDLTQSQLSQLAASTVWSFNGRTGHVMLQVSDLTGFAPLFSPDFVGRPTAPNPPTLDDASTQIATTAFVQALLNKRWQELFCNAILSFNGRIGNVVLNVQDICWAGGAPIVSPFFLVEPRTVTPNLFNRSHRIANTLWVSRYVEEELELNDLELKTELARVYAPLESPEFTGIPEAPMPDLLEDSGQIATTEWVRAIVGHIAAGVLTFNGRSGFVDLELNDVLNVGGAPILSPAFNGNPTAATQLPADNSTRLATTAFVRHAIDASVTSFNTRTGAVILTLADILGADGQRATFVTGITPTAALAGQLWFDTTQETTKIWDGSAWIAASPAAVIISDTAPANAYAGLLWWDSSTGTLFIRYASNWVEVT